MIYLANYGNGKFQKAQQLNTRTAYKKGQVDLVCSYSESDLDEDFMQKHNEIISQKRGAGYWLWKPYIILDALNKIPDGNYLVYADSGIYFTDSVKPLISVMEKEKTDIMPFSTGKHIEKNWTKRDIFIAMDCDSENYINSRQLWAGFIIFKVSDYSRKFVGEWLKLCCDMHLITDEPSNEENYLGYIETRHDQSIFSLLTKKWGIPDFRDPSQHGVFRKEKFAAATLERSNYPTIIDAHRQGTSGTVIQIKLVRVKRWIHNCINEKRIIPYNEQFR